MRIWYVFASLHAYLVRICFSKYVLRTVYSLRISGFSLRIFLWANKMASLNCQEFVVVDRYDNLEDHNSSNVPRRGLARKLSGSIVGALRTTVTGTAGAIGHVLTHTMAAVVDRPDRSGLAAKQGWVTFELMASDGVEGTGLFLDVEGARIRRGASLVVWPENGNANQLWFQDMLPQDKFVGRLQCRHNGLFVDIAGESEAAGAAVITWANTHRINQLFMVSEVSPQIVVLRSIMHGFALGVLASSGDELGDCRRSGIPQQGSRVVVAPLPPGLFLELQREDSDAPPWAAASEAALASLRGASEHGEGEPAAACLTMLSGVGAAEAVEASVEAVAAVPAYCEGSDEQEAWGHTPAASVRGTAAPRQSVVVTASRWLDEEGRNVVHASDRAEAAFSEDGQPTQPSATFLCRWRMVRLDPGGS